MGSVALVTVLAWRLDWHQVGLAFAKLDLRLWLAALGVHFLAQVISSARWRMLARVLGLAGGQLRFLGYYFIGMFFNLVLPTSVGGDVVRAWYLARQGGEAAVGPRTAAVLSVLADRANGLAVLIVVSCVGLAFYRRPLPLWVTATVAGLGAAAALGMVLLPVLPRVQQRLPPHRGLRRAVGGAVLFLQHPRVLTGATLLSVGVQAASVVLTWLIGRGLGLQVPWPYYCILTSVVAVLTLLPISVSGMGLREWGTAVLLEPLGVGAAEAVTLSLLTFAVQAAAGLSGGVVYLFGRFPRFEAAPAAAQEVPEHDYPVGGDPDQGRTRQPSAAASAPARRARSSVPGESGSFVRLRDPLRR
jgi:uncharacterized membrane protein YbhN (UPF0104 family)